MRPIKESCLIFAIPLGAAAPWALPRQSLSNTDQKPTPYIERTRRRPTIAGPDNFQSKVGQLTLHLGPKPTRNRLAKFGLGPKCDEAAQITKRFPFELLQWAL